MFAVFVCCVVLCSRGLCNGMITFPEVSYRMPVFKKPQSSGGQSSNMAVVP
jgi:hypothetical protein